MCHVGMDVPVCEGCIYWMGGVARAGHADMGVRLLRGSGVCICVSSGYRV